MLCAMLSEAEDGYTTGVRRVEDYDVIITFPEFIYRRGDNE